MIKNCFHLHRFFERDVNGVREYFRRRFGYECAGYPSFDDLERDDNLDIEVSCSGFTKEMEKDLLQEYGMESISDDEETDVEDEDEKNENEIELNRLRQQVDDEVKFSEERAGDRSVSKAISFNIQNYLTSLMENQGDEIDVFEDAREDLDFRTLPTSSNDSKDDLDTTTESIATLNVSEQLHDDDDDNFIGKVSSGGEEDDELVDLDPKSREYRLKMVEKLLSDTRSHRSYSTSASTIAPSVIQDRIKKNLNVKEKREQRKRCVAKGEASATTRIRNENRDTCKQYAGWDF